MKNNDQLQPDSRVERLVKASRPKNNSLMILITVLICVIITIGIRFIFSMRTLNSEVPEATEIDLLGTIAVIETQIAPTATPTNTPIPDPTSTSTAVPIPTESSSVDGLPPIDTEITKDSNKAFYRIDADLLVLDADDEIKRLFDIPQKTGVFLKGGTNGETMIYGWVLKENLSDNGLINVVGNSFFLNEEHTIFVPFENAAEEYPVMVVDDSDPQYTLIAISGKLY